MLEQITPMILTYNEEPNIARTLRQLTWANDIVIVDSLSTDNTLKEIQPFKQVRVFQRPFDQLATQWNYALKQTQIKTEWVLALDADYVLTDQLVDEIKQLDLNTPINGYRAVFDYCIHGKPLRGSLYPPVIVLFRRENVHYLQDGHAQRVQVAGEIGQLQAKIRHDDRKTLSHWLNAQDGYIRLEVALISSKSWQQLRWADRIRKLQLLAPFVIFFYCLFIKGGLLDGKAGWYYAFQRLLAELLLSLYLIEQQIQSKMKD